MLRDFPNLQAVEALLALARARSLRAAAAELALSPSAMSRRLQALEKAVGVSLLDRSGGAMTLTAAGRHYVEELEAALDGLRTATARLKKVKDQPVRVAASHSVSAEWLLPRLASLRSTQGLHVDVVAGEPLAALKEGRADIGIKGGQPPPRHLEFEPLIDGGFAIVASAPTLIDGRAPPRCIAALSTFPRLAVADNSQAWRDWLAAYHVDEQKLPPPILFDTFQMSSEAAANGFGVALMFPMVSERFLASGRLVPCFAPRQPISGRYWLIKATTLTIESAARSERVSKWLKQEAQKSLCAFAAYA